MLRQLRASITYANVMATGAVFLALGGSAYAVTALPKNSVGSKQLKNGAVKTKKIGNAAVTPPKVAKPTIALFKGQKGNKGEPGPGANKFYFSEAASSNDPFHPVLTTGPVREGVSCQPGTKPGDINLTVKTTVPNAISAAQWGNVAGTPFATDGTVPAGTSTGTITVASSDRSDLAAHEMLNVRGTVTSLDIQFGVVGPTNAAGVPAHCYMSGIEI